MIVGETGISLTNYLNFPLLRNMTTRFCPMILPALLIGSHLCAQSNTIDLFKLAQFGGLTTENRTLSPLANGEFKGIRINEQPGDGVVWLNGIEFSNGTIDLDIRGKDIIQQSFLGVAFHGLKKDSLEAIYFRPFNFRSNDSTKKSHSVEYVFHPDFPWERLRKEHPNIYEKGIDPSPAPDRWFHVKITVRFPEVNVYVNDNPTPSLSIRELSTHTNGKIGLWIGNNSGGDFANLLIYNE